MLGFGFMVFNASLNNSSVILWESVLLVEETGVPEITFEYSCWQIAIRIMKLGFSNARLSNC
jgi:hypothetical protein